MQPLLLIKQTIENNFQIDSLLLDGPNVKISDSSDIFSKYQMKIGQRTFSKSNNSFSVSVETNDINIGVVFKKIKSIGLTSTSVNFTDGIFEKGLEINREITAEEILNKIKNHSIDHFKNIENFYQDQELEWKVVNDKCFFSLEYSPKNKTKSSFNISAGIAPTRVIENLANNLIHIPGLRGHPSRQYKATSVGDSYPGNFEFYIANIIEKWKHEKSKKNNKYQLLIEDINYLGLASRVTSTVINDTNIQLKVSRFKNSKSTDCVNIADVGFGVSQVLPILVSLHAARVGQVVYIEQPELHLHPRAQSKLAKIFANAVNRGVLVIIETHSSILLRSFQTLVASNQLAKNKVSLNWFTQDEDTGITNKISATLDENGSFGEWPADFDNVLLEVESDYLNAVEANFINE